MESKDLISWFITILMFILSGILTVGLILVRAYYNSIEERLVAIEYAVGLRKDRRVEERRIAAEGIVGTAGALGEVDMDFAPIVEQRQKERRKFDSSFKEKL